MKLELKDYQEDAATRVLTGLRKGSSEYISDREYTAVSLSAPTGAGKTVIAAAVIERVLCGDPEGSTEPDPNAVFLWITDDPSLNEQTRKKIAQASERLSLSQLVTLDDGFDEPELGRGVVYFLNIQKLAKTSNLVTRKEGRRRHVMWDTISRTIESNGGHFYLVIDEAHRGTGRRSSESQTITQRLMNGDASVTAAPVVLGISATPERFDEAVAKGAQNRVPRKVSVSVAAVRESGLIKDVLSIEYRAETQAMETTLVRQAAANLREIDLAWNEYTSSESTQPVRPVLVLQIPAKAKQEEIGELLDVCIDEWEEFGKRHAVAHSLESHTAEEFGRHSVIYVKPQDIQDHPSVRLVIFKEALTTGWDCPRAETMVSLRTAEDETYIAQLIGRMVRSPLARRIETNAALNRVRLYLPHFDKVAVEKVKERLEKDDSGNAIEIETNVVDVPRNTHIPEEAFSAIEELASYHVPGPVHRSQVARLHKFAALLAGDGIIANAIAEADKFLVSVIEQERGRLDADGTLDALVNDVRTADVEVMEIEAGGATTVFTAQHETDTVDVTRLFDRSKRKFRDGLAEKFWGERVLVHEDDPYEAKLLTVALSNESSVVEKVESEAADRVQTWFSTHGDAIATKSEDRQSLYAEVRAMAKEPEPDHPILPRTSISMSKDQEAFDGHLYAGRDGTFRVRLGTWEKHCLAVESSRDDFVGWYRNPTGGQRALRIPYKSGSEWAKLYPDLVVLHEVKKGKILASIVDPHGHHLADAADKLRGLAAYAEKHGKEYARIVGVIRLADESYRMLNLKEETVRNALEKVRTQDEIEQVFLTMGASYG